MDLLLIARKIWRYKLATLPVIVLTLCGAVYAVAVKDPVYEAKSSYVLINPPAPPTPDEVARDPALGRVNADNPYTRFTDPSVVIQVLTGVLNSESARRALEDAGADSRYTVAPSAEPGYFTSPIVYVTGVGATPRNAVHTAEVVGDALKRELDRMQAVRGVDPKYAIKTHEVEPPAGAELRASGQVRTLVAVLALGAVLLFLVVSVADAVTSMRRQRWERAAWDGPVGDGESWSAGPWPPSSEERFEGDDEVNSNGDSQYDEAPIDLFPDGDRKAGHLSRGRGVQRLPDDDA